MNQFDAYLALREERTLGQIKVYAGERQMALASAGRIAECVRRDPRALLCLPSGNTPLTTFEILCRMQQEGDVSFRFVRFMQLDEWLGLKDESENCAHFLQKHFYGPSGIEKEQVRSFDIHARDMAAECEKADAYLDRTGPIDMMLLGIGMNGHLGLNEPGINWACGTVVAALSDTTKTVGQKYFTKKKELSRGITLGMRHILASKQVILQVSGSHKADIMRRVYLSEPSEALPATALKTHPRAEILTDAAAAAGIPV